MRMVNYDLRYKEELRSLFLVSRRNTFFWLDTSIYKLEDFELQTAGEEILVALIDDHVVGFISVWEETNFIHHLYVAEGYQQRRIGSILLA